MFEPIDPADLGRLIRQRGVPERPAMAEQVSEVRSDCFMRVPPLLESHTTFTVAAVVIEWRYRLPYRRAHEFHQFLAANERFIADSCETLMQGVHYRGTFTGLGGQRALYVTLWGYDTWEAQGEWSKVIADKTSRFYQVVRELRSYWTDDPNSTQEHFGAAAALDFTNQAFCTITLDADGGLPASAGGTGGSPS